MDGSRFDTLARSLSWFPSRRGAVRLLVGSALGGLLTLGALPTDAKKKKVTLCHDGQTISVSKKAKKKHLKHGDTLGACATAPAVPAGPRCPDPAAPHFCASANTCVPACPTGMVFRPEFCRCDCAVTSSCCQCTGGTSPFCTTAINDPIACATECGNRNPGGTPFLSALASAGETGICNTFGRCDVTCTPVSCRSEFDACAGGTGGRCQGDLKCFQPLGGGPTRCGRPTVTGSCGCTSHQQCADNHGTGAFCVTFPATSTTCTCGAGSPSTTFCATQA